MSTNPTADDLSLPPETDRVGFARTPAPDRPGLFLRTVSRLRRASFLDSAFLSLFRSLQAYGLSVVPNHYYWPIPDLRTLENHAWKNRSSRLELNLAAQERFAGEVVPKYQEELRFAESASGDGSSYHRNNGMFETIDAEVAHCMVRELRPRRIVEIGGGFSTRVLANAVTACEREGHRCELTTIEPYPDHVLKRGIPGLTRLITRRVQDVPHSLFESLEPQDILFIDSSHVVAVGSDVVFEFFEVFPVLRDGVIIHLHDIFYPSDYPREAVFKFLWFWSEQYLLEALLTCNPAFEVLWASSAMQLLFPSLVERAFPAWARSYARMPAAKRRFLPTLDGNRVWASSFWMRKAQQRGRQQGSAA